MKAVRFVSYISIKGIDARDFMKTLDIVTIDGPAGSGKSTVARRVAVELGFGFLDTGAMYRAVAWCALDMRITLEDFSGLEQMLSALDIQMNPDPVGFKIWLNGRDITDDIRQPHISQAASDFSTVGMVRDFCVGMQKKIGFAGRIVAEGRDMGSVVFPQARWKFFLTASPDERARRRLIQDGGSMQPEILESVRQQIMLRDRQDMNRILSPLVVPEGAFVLDTTYLSIDDVVSGIVTCVKKKFRTA